MGTENCPLVKVGIAIIMSTFGICDIYNKFRNLFCFYFPPWLLHVTCYHMKIRYKDQLKWMGTENEEPCLWWQCHVLQSKKIYCSVWCFVFRIGQYKISLSNRKFFCYLNGEATEPRLSFCFSASFSLCLRRLITELKKA